VLIYFYLRSARTGARLVWVAIVLLAALAAWQYFTLEPVTEEIVHATHVQNDAALTFKIDRDVMRENPYAIQRHVAGTIADIHLMVNYRPDASAIGYFKDFTMDGNDIAVTLVHPAPQLDSLVTHLNRLSARRLAINREQIAPLFERFASDQVNRLMVTLFKPDQFSQYESNLVQEIRSNPAFAEISSETITLLLDRAQRKSLLNVAFEKSDDAASGHEIVVENDQKIALTIHDLNAYSAHRTELLTELRAFPNLMHLSQSRLDELVAASQRRSFFLPYLILLLLTSLLILKIQKRYLQSDKTKKSLYVLLTFGGIIAIIWLIPGLNVFSRFVSMIIYFTVLSLYTIEVGDRARFKDNFRFLLMIFIYSGFWILYFQMFDSVLWYVKAYVDASSLNQFVNSALGFIGLDIHWFFDVEHVTVINAGTIILLQLVVSSIVKNTKALPTMIAGIAMGTVGMAILAISTDIWVFMVGIVIFSIGEMTAHPKFISYVGLTAPKDRVATYMGYIFLYGVIGSSIGAILGANMYVHFVDQLNQPRTLWLIFSGIGVVTILGLLLYNAFAPKKAEAD